MHSMTYARFVREQCPRNIATGVHLFTLPSVTELQNRILNSTEPCDSVDDCNSTDAFKPLRQHYRLFGKAGNCRLLSGTLRHRQTNCAAKRLSPRYSVFATSFVGWARVDVVLCINAETGVSGNFVC